MLEDLLKRYEVEKCFFIAELGSSHGGDLDLAIHLIDVFKASGTRVFKTQHIIAEEILHPKTGVLTLIGKEVNLYEAFKKLERDSNFYKKIKHYCDEKGLFFFASSFGEKSTKDLLDIGVEALKVASPESNYTKLLEQFKLAQKPVFLSSGVTTLEDIKHSLLHLDKNKTALLHCVTQYPAAEEEMNLLLLPSLKNYFQLKNVGLSDHSFDPTFVPSVALGLSCLMGETFILEKHVSLSREGGGLDDAIALTPPHVEEMLSIFQKLSKALKKEPRFFETLSPLKGADSSQIKMVVDVLKSVLEEEESRIRKVLGDGVKRLAPCEKDNYLTTNRSYRALKAIKKGEKLTEKNVAFLRAEKNLEVGLTYAYDELITKAKATKDIAETEAITLEKISEE